MAPALTNAPAHTSCSYFLLILPAHILDPTSHVPSLAPGPAPTSVPRGVEERLEELEDSVSCPWPRSDQYTRSLHHVSGGHLDLNLKIIVLRNEFEQKYLFE